MSPRLLVACEFSQRVTTAFLEKGFDAYSNDICDCEGPYKDRHLKMDARRAVLLHSWDLIIAHPPCTYLSTVQSPILNPKSGLNAERYLKTLEARDFFMFFWLNIDIPLCIENPLPHSLAKLPPYSQMVCPRMFGDIWSKRTCLWLKDLPPLLPTTAMPKKTKSYHYNKFGGHNKSILSPYLAHAMADQWAPLFL
jgi:hypothetical protein